MWTWWQFWRDWWSSYKGWNVQITQWRRKFRLVAHRLQVGFYALLGGLPSSFWVSEFCACWVTDIYVFFLQEPLLYLNCPYICLLDFPWFLSLSLSFCSVIVLSLRVCVWVMTGGSVHSHVSHISSHLIATLVAPVFKPTYANVLWGITLLVH